MNALRRVIGVSVLVAVPVVQPVGVDTQQRPEAAATAGNPQFEQLVDQYVTETYGTGGRRGSGGPSGGVAHPAAPPLLGRNDDGSAAYYDRRLARNREWLRELEQINRTTLTFDQQLDYRYLQGILKSNIVDGEKLKRWQQDPRLYLPRGLFIPRGGVNMDQSRPAESAARLLGILRQVPARLEHGKKNLTQYVALWVEPSKRLVDRTLPVFEQDVPQLAARVPDQREALVAESKKGIAALRDFRQFLETELPKRPVGEWRVGREILNFRLRELYLVDDIDADELYQWGRRQYAEQLHVLERAAARANPRKTWQEIERDHQEEHPTAESVVYDYLTITRRARDWLVDKDLVSFPNGAKDPAASSILTQAVSMKLGLDPRWGSEQREEYLRGRNIPLAWAIMTHEVYPGHGLLELWGQRNPRKLRAYDRSYSEQAWCYYVEWFLTPEFGFYPAERHNDIVVEMERNKLWRYARVIYEMGMHTGQVSFEEAVQLMRDGVLWSDQDAHLEVDVTSQGSIRGDAIATFGYHQFLQLRDDYFARMGSLGREGSIKDFNDRLMKIGMLPIKLIREALFHQLDEEQKRTTSAQ